MRYLSCAETAKLVRAALKREHPGVKFSVRSHTYAGGASIDVSWTDGPQSADVDATIGRYAGAGFDGMIDLKTYNHDWLYPDGHVESFQSEVGHSYGSTTRDHFGEQVEEGTAADYIAGVRHAVGDETTRQHSAGTLAYMAGRTDAEERVKQGAELVHFGADYVFTRRELSEAESKRLQDAVAFLGGEPGEEFDGSKRYGFGLRVGGRWLEESGWTLVHQLSHVPAADLAYALAREAARRVVNGAIKAGRVKCSRDGEVWHLESAGQPIGRVKKAEARDRDGVPFRLYWATTPAGAMAAYDDEERAFAHLIEAQS